MSTHLTQKSIDELKTAFARRLHRHVERCVDDAEYLEGMLADQELAKYFKTSEMKVVKTDGLKMRLNPMLPDPIPCEREESEDVTPANKLRDVEYALYCDFIESDAWKHAVKNFKLYLKAAMHVHLENVGIPKLTSLYFEGITPDNLENEYVSITKL